MQIKGFVQKMILEGSRASRSLKKNRNLDWNLAYTWRATLVYDTSLRKKKWCVFLVSKNGLRNFLRGLVKKKND